MYPSDCPDCDGTGYIIKPAHAHDKRESIAFIRLVCPSCAGTGRKPSQLDKLQSSELDTPSAKDEGNSYE
jgi:DnaJ-class molecular chaperone